MSAPRRSAPVLAALLLSAWAPGVASAASPSVVQVRVAKHLICSGTVVADRFVLTARHCVIRRRKRVRLSGVRVVTGGRRPRTLRLASIQSPRTRSVDLTLLELTSSSRLTPAKLANTAQRRRTALRRAYGWTSTRSLRSLAGRVTSRRLCHVAGSVVCVAAAHSPPSSRCRDAAGAALTLSSNGHRYLAGVGVAAGSGCARRSRAAFIDLTRASVARWIASAVAPQPVTLRSFIGRWTGTIEQDDITTGKDYVATISVTRNGAVREVVGTSD